MTRSLILAAALLAGTAASAQDGDPATLAERNTQAALDRIEALNPRLNAVIAVGAWLQIQESGGVDALKSEIPGSSGASSGSTAAAPLGH